MQIYGNRHGDSGVSRFQIFETEIHIKFYKNVKIYKYTDSLTGISHVTEMKRLAKAGKGLSTYIGKNRKKLKSI